MSISTSHELISAVFTQAPVFAEFIRAVDGVPRDALNLAGRAAMAGDRMARAWRECLSIKGRVAAAVVLRFASVSTPRK